MTHSSDNSSRNPEFYKAYLIRMWQDSPQAGWCASARSVQSGQVDYFPNLTALFAFLQMQAMGAEDAPPAAEENQ